MVTLTPGAVACLHRMGTRAGHRWLASGIWPRCPFRSARLQPLALAWSRAMFAVIEQARP